MRDRTAIDTLTGYLYQFDLTILKLLQLTCDDDEITIEGIEDVDLNSSTEKNAIQCKYHAKTEYNHSVIAKPIRLMLNHYKDVLDCKQNKIKYTYYGHFKSGHSKLTLPITLEFLKSNILTYTKEKIEHYHYRDLKLSDIQLEEFLNHLTVDIYANEYSDQLKEIYYHFKTFFGANCDDFEAENFYYNNALKVISNLAIEDNISRRKISKKNFLNKINSKQVLFHKWFIQFKEKRKLLADLREKYFTHYNISPFERIFIVEINQINYSRNELKEVIHLIYKKWSDIKSKNNPDTFCPYIYISGITSTQLIELKIELSTEGFKFKDGFDYYGSSFDSKSILEKATFHNEIKIKIINELSFIELLINEISKTTEVYQFYIDKMCFVTSNTKIKHVAIQVEEINDIKSII